MNVLPPLMEFYDVVGGGPRSGTCTFLAGGIGTCCTIMGVGGAIKWVWGVGGG